MTLRSPEGEANLRVLEFLQLLQKEQLLGLYLKHIEGLVQKIAGRSDQNVDLMTNLDDFMVIQAERSRLSPDQNMAKKREVHITFLCAVWTKQLMHEYLDHFQDLATMTGLNLQPMQQLAANGMKYMARYHQKAR